MLLGLIISVTSVSAFLSIGSSVGPLGAATSALASVAGSTCAIAGRSRDCHTNCYAYCSSHDFCELERKTRSSWPWSSEYCGWPWQHKCICRTCPDGFCSKPRNIMNKAIPLARKHVQRRIDDMTGRVHTSKSECAKEGGVCTCDGEVRYGANGIFTDWRAVSGSIRCTNDVFGDPVHGVRKACYCTHYWNVKCADEGRECSCNGKVRYGANGKFTAWRAVSGKIGCNNRVFGDPIWGTKKSCWCERADYANMNRAQWCADHEDRFFLPGCDGVNLSACWGAGIHLCDSLGDSCFGVMMNAGWTAAYKGVKICKSGVLVDKGDWMTRMKYSLETGSGDGFTCDMWQKVADKLAGLVANKGCSWFAKLTCGVPASFVAITTCEVLGLGPEDPLSHLCEAAAESAVIWGCSELCATPVEQAVGKLLHKLDGRCGNSELPTNFNYNVKDEWKLYFGNRNNHIRKPFMLNVLRNMKRYLDGIGYSSNNMLRLQAAPDRRSGMPRMSCSLGSPCFSGIEKQWPQKIGIYVNTRSDKLLRHTSPDTVAGLIIGELSQSTAVASRQNLAVAGSDVALTQANVGGHWNGALLATRDWSYDYNELKRYATCYESGRHCPPAGYNNRPQANKNMDVPLNNAPTYGYWILSSGAGSSCVSGDMLVESESEGLIEAGALKEGMKIRGKDANGNSQWCTVQDVYFNGMGTLFGNFTEEHLVLDESTGTVVPSGSSGYEHFGARYTIFTDCPVMENNDGELFTPLAETFCGARDFSWNEYIVLWRAIQQIVKDTGIFWFHLDETFTDCNNQTMCGNVTRWRDALPPVCDSLMACASSQDDGICDDFEQVAQTFFESHVRAERVEEIKNAYADYGSISLSVKESQNEDHLWMWVAIGAGGLVLMMATVLVTWRCFCQEKQDDNDQVAAI